MSNFTRILATVAVASIAVVGLSACSTPAPNDNKGIINPVIAPVTVEDPHMLLGKTTELKVNQVLNIKTETPTDWTGAVEKANVAMFLPGSNASGVVNNFGFVGLGEGETWVSIQNVKTGEPLQFQVKVVK